MNFDAGLNYVLRKMYHMQIGCHVSISGSSDKSVDNAVERKCSAFQIFTRNPRGWHAKELTKENIDNWIDTVSRGQGNRAEIENYYLNNEDAKKNMESVILENLAVKWVVDNAKVAEKDYSFDELVELR